MKVAKLLIRYVYFLLRLPILFVMRLVVPSRGFASTINRILLIRPDRLGDFVLSLPVAENLRLHYPEAQIDILVRPALAGLARMIPAFSNVLISDNSLSAIAVIRRTPYDLVIDMLCDYTIDSAFLTLVSGAGLRIGFKGWFRELFFSHSIPASQVAGKHMTDLSLELLKPLGVSAKITIPKISLAKDDPREMIIGIHPSGNYPSQRWPKERFAELAKRMLDKYPRATILVFGTPKEKKIVNFVVAQAGGNRIKAVFPESSALANLINNCRLLVCNNSGPLHLAQALGVPTVSTMGPTDPVRWWPKGENSIILRGTVSCLACGRGFCWPHRCMDEVGVEDMEKAVESLLK